MADHHTSVLKFMNGKLKALDSESRPKSFGNQFTVWDHLTFEIWHFGPQGLELARNDDLNSVLFHAPLPNKFNAQDHDCIARIKYF